MKQFMYADPTGGGDDITVSAPDWVEMPPDRINVIDVSGEPMAFDLDPDATEVDD